MKLNVRLFNADKIPLVRKHANDAGADIYMTTTQMVGPYATAKIPLGFGIDIPAGYCGYIRPRSSTTLLLHGLVTHPCPIDTGYTGEIHAIVSNMTKDDVLLRCGERYFQLVIEPIATPDFEIDYKENRGNGGFGGTGK